MSWFLVAILGYFFFGLVFVLDKFILTKSLPKPSVYTFYSTVFALGVFVLLPFGVEWLHGFDWLWAVLAGLGFGFGLWTMYLAVKSGEASHIDPFLGSLITVFIFVFSQFLLGEFLPDSQVAGVVVLIFAGLLLSYEKSRKHNGFHAGFLWAMVSALCFAVFHVGSKYIYGHYSFLTGLVWIRGVSGMVGLFLLFSPTVRSSFKRQKHIEKKTMAKKHAVSIVVVDKVLGLVGFLLIQYAVALGSVTMVNALIGVQYSFMFLLIYLFTRFLPKVFNEYFTKREMLVEVIAIVLVIIGSVFFVL